MMEIMKCETEKLVKKWLAEIDASDEKKTIIDINAEF